MAVAATAGNRHFSAPTDPADRLGGVDDQSRRFATVGLVLHPTKAVDTSLATIVSAAAGNRVRILAREVDGARVPGGVDVVADGVFAGEVDAVVALGGDGTMLGALRLLIGRPVPVLGVNHGNLGFLVEVAPRELPVALRRLAAGEFTIERYGCFDVGAAAGAGAAIDLATRHGFNDVVLGRPGRTGVVSVDLSVNGQRYGYYRGDAVVVATPMGSTAYNYSAGGPVVSPSSGAVVITPVAPLAGINRSVVLGADDRIALSVGDDSGPVAVDVDGTAAAELGPGDVLTAATRRDAAQVVRLSAGEHASRNRVKLSLLDLPLRRDQLLELIPPELRTRTPED